MLQFYRNRIEILDTNLHELPELFFRQRDKKRKDVRELHELDELNKLEIKDKDFSTEKSRGELSITEKRFFRVRDKTRKDVHKLRDLD